MQKCSSRLKLWVAVLERKVIVREIRGSLGWRGTLVGATPPERITGKDGSAVYAARA